MARIVKMTHGGPVEVKPGEEGVWICRCGLSKSAPFCDGSHVQAIGEESGRLYWYDREGFRNEVTEDLDGIVEG